MTDYTPTTEQMREWFAEPRTQAEAMSPDAHYEAAEMFDRWLAEVERAAAEKAWGEGNTEGARGQRDFHLLQQGRITEAEYKRREQARPNPYRRNEGENE